MQDQHPIIEELQSLSALPSPPRVALKIVEITRDPDKGARDLAEVLKTDAAISAKVLQVSNSTAYARSREVKTLSDAVNLLGVKSLSVISLGFSLKQSIPSFRVGDLNQDVLWKHSVATAVVARTLARVLGDTSGELAFMCGLMSRIGQLVFLSALPERYRHVVAEANQLLPTAAEEQAILGTTHHDVASLLLEKWELPSEICQTVKHWETNDTESHLDDGVQRLVNIVRTADTARTLLFDNEKAQCLQSLHAIAQESCGLAPNEIDRVLVACQTELQETLRVFIDQDGADLSCESILEMARDQLIQVSVKLATDLSSMSHQCEGLTESNNRLRKQSTTDSLTGLSNRFALDNEMARLADCFNAEKRRPVSIVMIDIDKFKLFNDTHGHSAGDRVLQTVGETLSERARTTDFVARYGGEEFTVILPNCDHSQAVAVADRFRAAISSQGIELEDKTLFITASAGVASSDSLTEDQGIQLLLEQADMALYEAKQSGRDRTVQFISHSVV